MKKAKIVLVVLLSFSIIFGLNSCNIKYEDDNLKDVVLEIYNDCLNLLSKCVLTPTTTLQGVRSFGEDEYTGTYTADYDNFSGDEYIFGGTALERGSGNELKATYKLKVTAGSALLYLLSGGDKYIIADTDMDGSYEFTIGSCDNYIIFEGDSFTGNLELIIE